jgi:hypothetical protein
MLEELDRLFAGPAPAEQQRDRMGPRVPPLFGLSRTFFFSQLDEAERAECQTRPGLLEAFAHALRTDFERQRGALPPHYTQLAECAACGPVWLWAGAPARVLACPWCHNRGAGLPVPRP